MPNPFEKYLPQGGAGSNPFAKYAAAVAEEDQREPADSRVQVDLSDPKTKEKWDKADRGSLVSIGTFTAPGEKGKYHRFAYKLDNAGKASKVVEIDDFGLLSGITGERDVTQEYRGAKKDRNLSEQVVEQAASGVLPGAAGMLGAGAGMALVNAAKLAPHPLIRFGVPVAGAIMGSLGAGVVQNKVLESVAPDLSARLAEDANQNPELTALAQAVGGNAPFQKLGMTVGKRLATEVGERAIGAGVGGGLATGIEAVRGFDEESASRIRDQAILGSLFNDPTKLGNKLMGAGQASATRITDMLGSIPKNSPLPVATQKVNEIAAPQPQQQTQEQLAASLEGDFSRFIPIQPKENTLLEDAEFQSKQLALEKAQELVRARQAAGLESGAEPISMRRKPTLLRNKPFLDLGEPINDPVIKDALTRQQIDESIQAEKNAAKMAEEELAQQREDAAYEAGVKAAKDAQVKVQQEALAKQAKENAQRIQDELAFEAGRTAASEAQAPVPIGPRNPEVSTGTGKPTPFEENMIAGWKASMAKEPVSRPIEAPAKAETPIPAQEAVNPTETTPESPEEIKYRKNVAYLKAQLDNYRSMGQRVSESPMVDDINKAFDAYESARSAANDMDRNKLDYPPAQRAAMRRKSNLLRKKTEEIVSKAGFTSREYWDISGAHSNDFIKKANVSDSPAKPAEQAGVKPVQETPLNESEIRAEAPPAAEAPAAKSAEADLGFVPDEPKAPSVRTLESGDREVTTGGKTFIEAAFPVKDGKDSKGRSVKAEGGWLVVDDPVGSLLSKAAPLEIMEPEVDTGPRAIKKTVIDLDDPDFNKATAWQKREISRKATKEASLIAPLAKGNPRRHGETLSEYTERLQMIRVAGMKRADPNLGLPRPESGFANPEALGNIASPAVGFGIGYQFGDSQEEKLQNGLIGAGIGLGGSIGATLAARAARNSPKLFKALNEGPVSENRMKTIEAMRSASKSEARAQDQNVSRDYFETQSKPEAVKAVNNEILTNADSNGGQPVSEATGAEIAKLPPQYVPFFTDLASRFPLVNEKVPGFGSFSEGVGHMAKGIKKMLGTHLENIYDAYKPANGAIMIKDHAIGELHRELAEGTDPLWKEARKTLSPEDFSALDLAAANGDAQTAMGIFRKYENQAVLEAAWYKNLETKAKAREMLIEAGRDIGEVDNYFRRIVYDRKGLRAFLGKEANVVKDALAQAQRDKGRALSPDEEEKVLNQVFEGVLRGQGGPSFTKERTMGELTQQMMRFYEPTEVSDGRWSGDVARDVVNRKFFGKSKPDEFDGAYSNESSIGKLIAEGQASGEISDAALEILKDNVNSLFHKDYSQSESTKKIWETVRKIQTYGFLSDVGTMLVQASDVFQLLWRYGPTATSKILKKQTHSLSDIGVTEGHNPDIDAFRRSNTDSTANPFKIADRVYGNAVRRLIGTADSFFKSAAIKAASSYIGKLVHEPDSRAFRQFSKEYSELFPKEWPSILKSLQSDEFAKGEWDFNARKVIFTELAKQQPVTKAGRAQAFSEGSGLEKAIYALKSYPITQLNILRREAYNQIKRGEVSEGLVKLLSYMSVVAAGGQAIQFAKDKLLQRDVPLSDYIVGGLLQFAMIPRYFIYRSQTVGSGTAALESLLPAASLVNDMGRDALLAGRYIGEKRDAKGKKEVPDLGSLMQQAELPKYIPYVGREIYNLAGRGKLNAQKQKENERKGIERPGALDSILNMFNPPDSKRR